MRQHEQNKYMLLYAILLFLTANPILSAEGKILRFNLGLLLLHIRI